MKPILFSTPAREILFRGKRPDNGEWVYGFLYVTHGGEYEISRYDEQFNIELYTQIVDPATVGQYTGLADKNGKRIFEWDVLDCIDRIVYVTWAGRFGTWDSEFMSYTDQPRSSNGITPDEWPFRATVIGNIHDKEESK